MGVMACKTADLSTQGQGKNLDIQTVTALNAFALNALSTYRGINRTLRQLVCPEPLDEFTGMDDSVWMIRLFIGMTADAVIAERCPVSKWYFILLVRVKIILRGSLLDRRRSLGILFPGPLAG